MLLKKLNTFATDCKCECWDDATDKVIAVLAGSGFLDWSDVGGLSPVQAYDTGDILFTTNAHTAGDGYTITLYMKLQD